MYKKPQSNARKVWAIVLIVYACIGLVFMPSVIARVNTRFNPVMLLPYALILLVGILLLPKKPRELGDFWKTEDPKQTQKVIRKVGKVQSDSDLVNIGRNAPLEDVARAAFGQVSSQKDIAFFVRYDSNRERALIALEYLNDDVELKEIALKCKEPVASAALERMRSEKLFAELAASRGTELGLKAVERLNDPGLLTALANDDGAPQQVRREALRKLGKPALGDGILLASPDTNDADGRQAADRILETKDPAQIAWTAEMLCKGEKAPTPAGRDFLNRAAAEWPDAMLPLGTKTWSNGYGDIIRAAAWEAQGCVTQADQLRLSSPMFSSEEKAEGRQAAVGDTE